MSRRYLAVLLPLLPIDRLRRQHPELSDQPIAVWTRIGQRRVLSAAEAPGLHPGQALADAQAIAPDLTLFEADPATDAALLDRLALWALRFTPLAALDPPDGLMLDVTGVAGLFGGEATMLATVLRSFQAGGYRVTGALAGTPGAAAVLARTGGAPRVLPAGTEWARLAPLPLAALRLPPDMLQALAHLGLRRISDLARQPRAPLARRFGRILLDALDDATGARPRPIQPVREPAAFVAARNLLEPILTRPAIEHVLRILLEELCQGLAQASQGARRLVLRGFRVDRVVQEVAIGTGAASHAPQHLMRLFAEGLDRLEPDLGFERMVLEAVATDPLQPSQAGLSRGTPAAGIAAFALAELLDQIGQRIRITRPLPLDSHWPEYASTTAEPYDIPAPPPAWGQDIRPVRLLQPPLALAVTALVPDGPPVQLRCGPSLYRVLLALGPERLKPEWWGEDLHRPIRDYFRVQTVEGPRFWVCRLCEPGDAPRWYLHGELA